MLETEMKRAFTLIMNLAETLAVNSMMESAKDDPTIAHELALVIDAINTHHKRGEA